MSDLTLEILTKFHREVLLPDMERIAARVVGDLELRMNGLFDAMYQRLEKLEAEYHMLVVAMQRVEERLDRVEQRLDRVDGRLERIEQRLDRVALKSEVQELRSKVEALERRIAEIDAAL